MDRWSPAPCCKMRLIALASTQPGDKNQTRMQKRYQVFVSSTYVDLQTERQKVFQTLMEMDCIPAGMELFSAIDDDQMSFIKRVIDDCDYYIIIIGGRYGSISSIGISYTEQEYDYAASKGIRVIALIHKSPGQIPAMNSESNPASLEKLRIFREKLQTGRIVKYWNSADELPGIVALSVAKQIKSFPAVGWVRANTVANNDLLQQLNTVRQENESLRRQLSSGRVEYDLTSIELASLDEAYSYEVSIFNSKFEQETIAIQTTWRKLFKKLSIGFHGGIQQSRVKGFVFQVLASNCIGDEPKIDDVHISTVRIQFHALGLIDRVEVTDGEDRWRLTPAGTALMSELYLVRKKPTAGETSDPA